MAMLKEFSIPLMLMLLLLLVYLLLIQRLPPTAFAIAFVGVLLLGLVSAIVMSRSSDVSEIGAKLGGQGAELLVKMERVRDEIYAKAESVRRTTETVAEMAVFSMTKVGRFADGDLQAGLLDGRDRMRDMLRQVGASEARIEEITLPLTDTVAGDVATEIWREAQKAIPDMTGLDPAAIRAEFTKRLRQSPVGSAVEAVKPHLEKFRAWNDKVRARVEDYDDFRRTGRLPARRESGGGIGFGVLK